MGDEHRFRERGLAGTRADGEREAGEFREFVRRKSERHESRPRRDEREAELFRDAVAEVRGA